MAGDVLCSSYAVGIARHTIQKQHPIVVQIDRRILVLRAALQR
jgi:hypothetical protein